MTFFASLFGRGLEGALSRELDEYKKDQTKAKESAAKFIGHFSGRTVSKVLEDPKIKELAVEFFSEISSSTSDDYLHPLADQLEDSCKNKSYFELLLGVAKAKSDGAGTGKNKSARIAVLKEALELNRLAFTSLEKREYDLKKQAILGLADTIIKLENEGCRRDSEIEGATRDLMIDESVVSRVLINDSTRLCDGPHSVSHADVLYEFEYEDDFGIKELLNDRKKLRSGVCSLLDKPITKPKF